MVYVTDAWRGPCDEVEQLIWGREVPLYTSRHYLYTAFAAQVAQRQGRLLLDGVGGEFGPSSHGEGFYPELLLRGQWWLLGQELHWRAVREERSYWI